jgi:hypothetical protein
MRRTLLEEVRVRDCVRISEYETFFIRIREASLKSNKLSLISFFEIDT